MSWIFNYPLESLVILNKINLYRLWGPKSHTNTFSLCMQAFFSKFMNQLGYSTQQWNIHNTNNNMLYSYTERRAQPISLNFSMNCNKIFSHYRNGWDKTNNILMFSGLLILNWCGTCNSIRIESCLHLSRESSHCLFSPFLLNKTHREDLESLLLSQGPPRDN